MSNYKTFKNEQPEAGRLLEIAHANEHPGSEQTYFSMIHWEDGIPYWKNNGTVKPHDMWRYSGIGPKIDPKECHEQQTECNTQSTPLADLPKIEFSVEDGLLVGKNRETGWCVGIPVNEAYDALLDYSRLVAISSQTPVSNTVPVSNNLRPLPKDFANNAGIAASTPAPNNMSWSQEFETRDLHIKALENLIGRQVETINESDSIIKKHKESINSLHQLIATKNAELDSLRIKNMELTARLNQS